MAKLNREELLFLARREPNAKCKLVFDRQAQMIRSIWQARLGGQVVMDPESQAHEFPSEAEARVAEMEVLLRRAKAVIHAEYEDEIEVRAAINHYLNERA